MPAYIADEREHRRGLVLGLTMAEVLTLLVFLLLIALTPVLAEQKRQIDRMREESAALSAELDRTRGVARRIEPVIRRLEAEGRIDLEEAADILPGLVRAESLRAELDDAERKIAELEAALGEAGEARSHMRELAPVLTAAVAIDPAAPPAVTLKRLLEKLGPRVDLDDLPAYSDLLAERKERAELKEKYEQEVEKRRQALRERDAAIEARDRMAKDRNEAQDPGRSAPLQAGGSGGGLMFPSCWTGPDGRTEYLLDVTIVSSGYVVRNVTAPKPGRSEEWRLIASLPRERQISSDRFNRETRSLFQWSRDRKCRFAVNLRDTPATSKQTYKSLRKVVERHFYIRDVN